MVDAQVRPGIIYIAVNRVNQKAYVGQTTHDLGHRSAIHFTRAKTRIASYFQRAINKYGRDGFDFAVLERCASKPELNIAERRWIAELGSVAPHGYNIAAGGEGSLVGRKTQAWVDSVTSLEYREKHRQNMRELMADPAFAKSIGAGVSLRRRSLTPDQRESWRVNAATARKGISSGMVGDSNNSRSPEARAKISASKLGKNRPEELKQRLAQIGRMKWADPEYRRRVLSAREAGRGAKRKGEINA